MRDYFGYNYLRRILEERLGEIKFDIDRTQDLLKDYEKELKETERALRELRENENESEENKRM